MNTKTQLSLLNTDKHREDSQNHTQSSSFDEKGRPDRIPDIVPLPDRPFTYGDVKGRAFPSLPAQPVNATKSQTADKQTSAVPAGYESPPTEDEKYLSVRAVARRYGVSVATIWRWSKEDSSFPDPFVLRKGTTRWRLSQLLIFENRSKEA